MNVQRIKILKKHKIKKNNDKSPYERFITGLMFRLGYENDFFFFK